MLIVPVLVYLSLPELCLSGFKMISIALRGNHSEVYNPLFAYI